MAAERVVELDRVLVERARTGDRSAFDELFHREAPGAWRLALAVVRQPGPAAGAVAAAFAKVLTTADPVGADPHAPVRGRLLAATRAAAIDGARPAGPVLDLAAPVPAEANLVAQAFHDLPERWRSVLWLTDVERVDPAVAAAVLGLPGPGAAQLADRARAGLREGFLQTHHAEVGDPVCARIAAKLDGYAREELSIRDANRVRHHLDGCPACRDRLAELDDLLPLLGCTALPMPAELAASAASRWATSVITEAGPLHLVTPGGRRVPAWAERALAGAAAAVITLGITGAIIAGGRGKARDDRLARPSASDSPVGSADGEGALGATDLPLVLPDGTAIGGIASGSSRTGTASGASGSERARSSVTTTSTTEPAPASPPAGGGSPTPAPVAPAPVPPTSPPPTTPPAPSEPADAVTGIVEEIVGLVDLGLTDECTGTLLDAALGCDTTDAATEPTGDTLPTLGL